MNHEFQVVKDEFRCTGAVVCSCGAWARTFSMVFMGEGPIPERLWQEAAEHNARESKLDAMRKSLDERPIQIGAVDSRPADFGQRDATKVAGRDNPTYTAVQGQPRAQPLVDEAAWREPEVQGGKPTATKPYGPMPPPDLLGSRGSALIAIERNRQKCVELFTAEFDARRGRGELATAALCYLDFACSQTYGKFSAPRRTLIPPKGWPFAPTMWKPTDSPIRNLVKAGALISAEIDRGNVSG